MNQGIRHIFSQVPHTYELVNHILTWGFDTILRRQAARLGAKINGRYWLDICTGTGEMARCLSAITRNKTTVIAADFSFPMLTKNRPRRPLNRSIIYTQADAGTLPFSDSTFDLVTIAFSTRNLNSSRDALVSCLKEFYRVLKPGGRFVNLETSQPSSPLLRWLFHKYVTMTVKPIGRFISGSASAYAYLARTIPRFYKPEELSRLLYQSGFSEVQFKPFLCGVYGTHIAIK